MVDPSLVITIDRTLLSLSDLVLAAQDGAGGLLAITDYTDPAIQPRVTYAPESDFIHGKLALGYTLQQTILPFTVAPFDSASEAATETALAELAAALLQFPSYPVHVAKGNAPVVTWQCDPATLAPVGPRTYVDLRDHDPEWRATIPCYPIRSIA